MIEKNICRRCKGIECSNENTDRKRLDLNSREIKLIPNSSIVGCIEPILNRTSCSLCLGKTCVNLQDGKSHTESIPSKYSETGYPIHTIVYDKRIQDCEKFKDILL